MFYFHDKNMFYKTYLKPIQSSLKTINMFYISTRAFG
jgi:hypothetical protein